MDSEDDNGALGAQDTPVAGAGAQLRAAREGRELTLAHIAAETRIPLRHLEAIEGDDFESLPSRTYAIGFTRTYAKALGLDDVAIVDAVRAELAEGSMRRAVASPGMQPGDPARLPSAGLAWGMLAALVVLAAGIFAFYNSQFRAGQGPASLISAEPAARASAGARPAAASAGAGVAAAVPGGPVVFTALEEGIWVRLYEEGGERLAERTLKQGETIAVPEAARDPRINTGRPDGLAITIGGKPVAKLSERPETMSGVAVSAAALAARAAAAAAPVPGAGAAPGATAAGAPSAPRAVRRAPPARRAVTAPSGEAVAPPAAAPAPAPAPEVAPPAAPAPAPGTR